jgi:hypothetical protein
MQNKPLGASAALGADAIGADDADAAFVGAKLSGGFALGDGGFSGHLVSAMGAKFGPQRGWLIAFFARIAGDSGSAVLASEFHHGSLSMERPTKMTALAASRQENRIWTLGHA